MGDRCYMTVSCRRQDVPRFEELGFEVFGVPTESPDAPDALIELVDEQANYAHSGSLPTDIPWVGRNAEGGDYGPCDHACDGQVYREMASGSNGGYVIQWDMHKNRPVPGHVDQIRRFVALEKRVNRILKRKP